jgi:hypothetical protein
MDVRFSRQCSVCVSAASKHVSDVQAGWRGGKVPCLGRRHDCDGARRAWCSGVVECVVMEWSGGVCVAVMNDGGGGTYHDGGEAPRACSGGARW